METKIYRAEPGGKEEAVGWIDEDGNVYDIKDNRFIGWIDYDRGDIYEEEDILLGWIAEDGEIVAHLTEDDDDIEVGYVSEDGGVYVYSTDEDEQYLGRVIELQDEADGAAAMLLFFMKG